MGYKEKTLARANRTDKRIHTVLLILFAILFICVGFCLRYNNLELCKIYLSLVYIFTVLSIVYDIWMYFVFMGIIYSDEKDANRRY